MRVHDQILLMIPGPSLPYPDAVLGLNESIEPHYGVEWTEYYHTVIDKLKKLFGSRQEVHIYPGPASAVMEMGIASIIDKGDKVIIVNKGFFIDRFRYIAELWGAETIQIAPEEYGESVNLDELGYAIDTVKPKAVIIVHSETSTGVLEDIDEISRMIPDDTFLILDSVSSYGAVKLKCDDWGVDICVGYPSKALGGINGLTPFMVSGRLWESVKPGRRRPKSFTLDLTIWRDYVEKWRSHPYPVSLSTPLVKALDRAASRVLSEGIERVEERHYRISRIVRDEIRGMGLKPLCPDDHASPTVTVFRLPRDRDFNDVIKRMYEDYGILISSTWLIGINGLRIGHMGYTAQEKFIIPTLYALRRVLELD